MTQVFAIVAVLGMALWVLFVGWLALATASANWDYSADDTETEN